MVGRRRDRLVVTFGSLYHLGLWDVWNHLVKSLDKAKFAAQVAGVAVVEVKCDEDLPNMGGACMSFDGGSAANVVMVGNRRLALTRLVWNAVCYVSNRSPGGVMEAELNHVCSCLLAPGVVRDSES